jgi:hypothetical protein
MTARDRGGVVPTGIYWDRPTWELARSAYIADLDTDPATPDAFLGWLQQALSNHAALTPGARAELAAGTTREDTSRSRGFSKAYPLPVEIVQAMEQAIIADRRELGRVVSRSGFARQAVAAAAERARIRLGYDLPPAPARLPNRPPRRQ